MNVILIGYRCTGKTTVGKRLAARLELPFYDTDALIQEDGGRTIEQLVATDGWPAFRAAEKRTIAQLALQDNCVIALGGGAVLDPENVAAIKATGRIIWLMAGAKVILERMARDEASPAQRPPLQGRDRNLETAIILEERTPVYEAAAHFIVDTEGKSIEEIAEEIIKTVYQ